MSRQLLTVLLIGAVLGSGLGIVYSKHQSRRLFNELQALLTYRDDREIEWELRQLEQSTWATEAVVDQAARTRLKMVVPTPDDVVYIKR